MAGLARVSDGVLVHPFGDGAVAADLVTGRAHIVNAGAAWLLTTDAESVDDLVADLPAAERAEAADRILDALDTLRTPGLVGRHDPFETRVRPTGSAHDPPGAHVGLAHQVLAEHIAFRSDDADLLGRVDAFLGSGIAVEPTLLFDLVPGEGGRLDLFTEDVWHFLDEDQFFVQLPAVLNDYAVRSHDVVALHAGAVRTPDGRTLVLLGHSDVGKSTLTGACVAAGCDYLSDETIGIAADGALVGYPKPLTLAADAHAVLGLRSEPTPHLRAAQLRADVELLDGSSRIDEVLLVHFDPRVEGVVSERLEPTGALEQLCAHTLNLGRLGTPGLATLCATAEQVPVSTFRHPGIEVAVPALLDR